MVVPLAQTRLKWSGLPLCRVGAVFRCAECARSRACVEFGAVFRWTGQCMYIGLSNNEVGFIAQAVHGVPERQDGDV